MSAHSFKFGDVFMFKTVMVIYLISLIFNIIEHLKQTNRLLL